MTEERFEILGRNIFAAMGMLEGAWFVSRASLAIGYHWYGHVDFIWHFLAGKINDTASFSDRT